MGLLFLIVLLIDAFSYNAGGGDGFFHFKD